MQDVHYYEAPLEPTRVQRSAHDQMYVSIGNLTAESRFLHTHSSTQQERFENDKLWIADAKACLRMRFVAPQAEASGLRLTHTPEGVGLQGHETSQEKPELFHTRKRARETGMQEDDTDLNSSSTQSKQQSLNQISTDQNQQSHDALQYSVNGSVMFPTSLLRQALDNSWDALDIATRSRLITTPAIS